MAEEADYRATYRLLSPVMAATLDNVSDTVRETVGTVAQVNRDRQGDGVSYVELGQALGITREAARQRCKQPLRAGFLVNEEFRQGYAAKLILGEPLPEPRAALPPHEVLFAGNVPNSPCELDASLQPVVANAEATVKQPAKVPDPSTLTLNQVDGAVDGAMCSPDGDLGLAVKASSPNSDGGGHV